MRKNAKQNLVNLVLIESYNPYTKKFSGFCDKVVELPLPIYVLKEKK